MRRKPEQLRAALQKSVAPVYLICGDEPLQVMECQDMVRTAAREQGYTERVVLDASVGIDWPALQFESESLSLFSSRRLIEVRLGASKPGTEGAAAIARYCEQAGTDNLLMVSSAKLDGKAMQSAWVKTVDRIGEIVQVWPVKAEDMPAWIERRLQAQGMTANTETVRLLADRVEGNLLAAVQDITKLGLLAGGRALDTETVLAAVGDSARYDLFALADSFLGGDASRGLRMLRGLRDEGVEPILVCWVLTRELRALCLLAANRRPEEAIPGYRLFPPRDAAMRAAARRLGTPPLRVMLRMATRIDRTIKGVGQGRPWDALTDLCLCMAGKPLGKLQWM
jgi:DNA polymerase-3 subunit delta